MTEFLSSTSTDFLSMAGRSSQFIEDDDRSPIGRDAGRLADASEDIGFGISHNLADKIGARYSGLHFVDASAGGTSFAGTGQVAATSASLPVWTNDQIANQLVSGYWAGDVHSWNVTQGGTLTVNISTLNSSEQTLALAALSEWTDIIGVHFQPITSGAQITFDDSPGTSGPIASTDASWSNGIISSAHVHISTSWVTRYGTALDTYSFQTYVHEIGHALGLGHPGNYDSTATYPTNALFANDAWSTSAMSYFDQSENTYFANQGFSLLYVETPMVADIVAMQSLYGLSTTTRPGDTTYGYHSNAGGIFDATLYPDAAYTIYDSGGNNTIDYSGSSASQLINLNPETFSNVNGYVGNLEIARGVIIQNAIGGSGNDTIIGNSADNVLTGGLGADTLTGGGGDDTFLDTVAGHNGDTITDFHPGDKIVFSDATLGSFTYSLSGNTLTYTGGSMTLDGLVKGKFIARTAASGGVVLTESEPHNDFSGAGRSDILWRSDSGQLSDWLGQPNGGFINNDANAFVQVPTSWHVVGTGDFNGDGRVDMLWRSNTGVLSDWLGTANGGFTNNDANALVAVSTDWQVAGVGDFTGNGRADILWRNTVTGEVSDWLGTASGGFTVNDSNSRVSVPLNWTIAGIGDFNGDGISDILWRGPNGEVTDWLGTSKGGWIINDANALKVVPSSWHIAGVGDFNGDAIDDILWRSDTGQLSDWLGQPNGGFINNDAHAFTTVPTNWHIAGVGDFNGDAIDDILWRSDAGQLSDWLGQPNGGFINNDAHAFTTVPTNWHTQPDQLLV